MSPHVKTAGVRPTLLGTVRVAVCLAGIGVCYVCLAVIFAGYLTRLARPGALWDGSLPDADGAWAVRTGPKAPYHLGACTAEAHAFVFANTTAEFVTNSAFGYCSHMSDWLCAFVGNYHGAETRCTWEQRNCSSYL